MHVSSGTCCSSLRPAAQLRKPCNRCTAFTSPSAPACCSSPCCRRCDGDDNEDSDDDGDAMSFAPNFVISMRRHHRSMYFCSGSAHERRRRGTMAATMDCSVSSSCCQTASEFKCLKRGVKEVVKSIRRGNKGLCVIAGNISPIDVITHVPVLCEENDIPYVYVPSKEDIATAGSTKRPTCCVLILTKPTKGELSAEEEEKLKADYSQVEAEMRKLASSLY